MVVSTVFAVVVLLPLWTIAVLSAVPKISDTYFKDTKNITNSTTLQKLTTDNNSGLNISDTNNNVDVSETRSHNEEEVKEESRKKKDKQDMMTRILPMMIIPFMLQTAIIPMMLTMLKFMLIKSAFIGKMAILLGLLNMFRVSNNQGGVFTHNIHLGHDEMHDRLAAEHYGYSGGDEIGAYVNRRKRSFRYR